MNNKVFVAKLSWLTSEQGGRKTAIPMFNEKYGPRVVVNGHETILGSGWSLLCYNFEKLSEYETFAHIRYLNTDAAPDIIEIGSHLELFEGTKKVADAIVLSVSDYVFKTVI